MKMETGVPNGTEQPKLIQRLERLEAQNLRLTRSLRATKFAIAATVAIGVAVSSVPLVQAVAPFGIIRASRFEVVGPGGRVRASWGLGADGNVLTFLDKAGHKTVTVGDDASESVAGLSTWDGNNVIAGNGIVRTAFGESNPNVVGANPGFGSVVLDGNGKERNASGLSFDLATNDFVAIDTNGTSTGIGVFPNGFASYFANDANGKNRQFGGITLDGKTNDCAESDSNGKLRVFATQNPDDSVVDQNGHFGNGFGVVSANGRQRTAMFSAVDDSIAGFQVFDINNVGRINALLTGKSSTDTSFVDTLDANGNVTGHLP
jgi:hypothetical protein